MRCGGMLDIYHHCDGIELWLSFQIIVGLWSFEALHVWKPVKLRTNCAQWGIAGMLKAIRHYVERRDKVLCHRAPSQVIITVATCVLSAV